MKFALVFAAVLAVSGAQPLAAIFRSPNRWPATGWPPTFNPFPSNRVPSSQAATVLPYDNEANPDGSYRYNVQIDSGITAQAQGTPRNFGGNPPPVPVVSQGSVSWTSPEYQLIVMTYVSDANGHQPSGDQPPPPASDIARSVVQNIRNQHQIDLSLSVTGERSQSKSTSRLNGDQPPPPASDIARSIVPNQTNFQSRDPRPVQNFRNQHQIDLSLSVTGGDQPPPPASDIARSIVPNQTNFQSRDPRPVQNFRNQHQIDLSLSVTGGDQPPPPASDIARSIVPNQTNFQSRDPRPVQNIRNQHQIGLSLSVTGERSQSKSTSRLNVRHRY